MLQVGVELFRRLIETAPDAILLLNDRGVIELANQQTRVMLGYDHRELYGQSVGVVLPKWYHQGYFQNVTQSVVMFEHRTVTERISTIAKRKDQVEFNVSAFLKVNPSPTQMLVTCILQDEHYGYDRAFAKPIT